MNSEIFQSKRCDCQDQWMESIQEVAEKKGVLIYLNQEGRGN